MPDAFRSPALHSEYSVVDGTIASMTWSRPLPRMASRIAVTDLSNLFRGARAKERAEEGRAAQSSVPMCVRLEPEEPGEAPTRLLLLVPEPPGYLRLSELLGEAWTAPGQRSHAWVYWASLCERDEG